MLGTRTINQHLNLINTIWLSDFCKILDITFHSYDGLDLLFEYDPYLSGSNQKMYNIWITESTNVIDPPSEFYKFFKTIEKRHSEVDLSKTNSGKVIPVDIIQKFYIFIQEIKTVAENREEKLNEII